MPVNHAEYGPNYQPHNDLHLAYEVIRSTYGDVVSHEAKRKFLTKFGKRDDIDNTGYKTVMSGITGDHENILTSNAITSIISSSGSDTETVKVEGHTRSGLTGDLTFTVQSVTLTGQTAATLTTPLARATRITNDGANDLVGNIYVYEGGATTGGVPDDNTEVHAHIPAGFNQTEKCATSVSSVDYWIIVDLQASVLAKTAANVDFVLEVREKNKTWKKQAQVEASRDNLAHIELHPPLIVPANSDVRVTAKSASGTGIEVAAWLGGYLAIVVG